MENYHLVQITHPDHGIRVGVIRNNNIILLNKGIRSSYALFLKMINENMGSSSVIENFLSEEVLAYDPIYEGKDVWKLLPPVNCPENPMQCMLSGTGLTHKASAKNRQKMHEIQKSEQLTDSMIMYLWGEEGGKPVNGKIGVQPEWFYKGNGTLLKAHGETLVVPNYADDGGEEPEIAGIYLVNDAGIPFRIGFAQANEFSDHVMEKKNYLYLAPSKIRNCAIGPELIVGREFDLFNGEVRVTDNENKIKWASEIQTGESAMSHSLANLEYHHFKYKQHRIPGQLHVHFYGAGAFSFGEGISLLPEDKMYVSFENMGRPLVNPLAIEEDRAKIIEINKLN